MLALRNKLLLAAAAVALGAFFAPRPAEASIPRDIPHLQRTPPPAVPAPVVDSRPVEFRRVVVEVDGILFELICRNDPVNSTDPTGLDSLMLTGEGKAYWAIEKDWYGPNPTVRTVEIGTWGNGVVNLAAQFGGGALRIPELQAAAIQTYVLNESGRSVMSEVSEDLQNGYISAVLGRVQAGSYATKSAGREIAASTLDTVVLGPLTALGNAVSPGQPYLSPSEIRKFWGVLSDGVNEKSPTFRNTRCTVTFGMSAWGAYRGLNAFAAESGALQNANYAQRTFSQTFSSSGTFAGQTVEDVAGALRSGTLSPADVPVQYIVRDGNTLMLNTRSAQALEQAGIPRAQWNAVNASGDAAAQARLTAQLQRNGLTSRGIRTVTPGH